VKWFQKYAPTDMHGLVLVGVGIALVLVAVAKGCV
jgi:hypothetical protein